MATTSTTDGGKRTHFIAVDVHGSFCEGGWVDRDGRERGRFRLPTNIPALAAALGRVPKPRRPVIEEGHPLETGSVHDSRHRQPAHK